MNSGSIGTELFAGPGWLAAPTTGSPAGAAILLRRRRRSVQALPPDLLSALIAYLKSAPTLVPALSVGFGQGGFGQLGFGGPPQVYDEQADAGAYPPFVVLSAYSENLPGETHEDQPIEVEIWVRTEGLDQARTIGRLIKDAVDSPNLSPTAVGRDRLIFQGGEEAYVLRNNSKPERMPGIAKGGAYAYVEIIDYQFFVDPEQ